MASSLKIVSRDKGFKRLLRQTTRAGRIESKVGIFGARGSRVHTGGDLTIAEIALLHEFGTANAPPRSIIRAWFDADKTRLLQLTRLAADQVVRGRKTESQALDQLGRKLATELRDRINDGIDPPNAPATVALKGSSTPLIDTGQLLNAVDSEVGK